MPGDRTNDYVERINRAIDFVIQNLAEPLHLESVARQAHFSPFHFHRVFRALVGETLNQFVTRLRLERALRMLAHGRRRNLTEIAIACGFASSSDFSRRFKERYGLPPSIFDLDSYRNGRREALEVATFGDDPSARIKPLPADDHRDEFEVQLRQLPRRTVAYVRVHDSYRPGAVRCAAAQLLGWAEQRGLADGQWLGYMWDDPEIVALEQCRYDVGLEIPEGAWSREVGRFEFPPMLVAQIEIRGGIDLELRALDWLYRWWLPRSGFVPADQPGFEAWIGRPFQHGDDYFEFFLQLPLERL